MPARWFLRTDAVRDHLDLHHWSHARVALRLGISRPYWSQLLNRRRALSPDVRHLILSCEAFTGLAEDALWERVCGDDDLPVPQ